MRKVRRDGALIKANRGERNALERRIHLHSANSPALKKRLSSCRTRCSYRSPSGYTSRTKSYPCLNRALTRRYASRLKRRDRFLRTAFPYFRAKVNAIRLVPVPFSLMKSFAPGHEHFRPRANASRISSLPFKRSTRLNRPVTLPAAPARLRAAMLSTASFRRKR